MKKLAARTLLRLGRWGIRTARRIYPTTVTEVTNRNVMLPAN